LDGDLLGGDGNWLSGISSSDRRSGVGGSHWGDSAVGGNRSSNVAGVHGAGSGWGLVGTPGGGWLNIG
jgi:hypothetical protein